NSPRQIPQRSLGGAHGAAPAERMLLPAAGGEPWPLEPGGGVSEKGRSGGAASERDRKFRVGLARAFGGAIFFSLPMLMTMELWSLDFYMDRLRLALFMALMVPFLIVLDHYSGFE